MLKNFYRKPIVLGNQFIQVDGTLRYVDRVYGGQSPFSVIAVQDGSCALEEGHPYYAEVSRTIRILAQQYDPDALIVIGNAGQKSHDVLRLISGFLAHEEFVMIGDLHVDIRLRDKNSVLEKGNVVYVGCSDPRLRNEAFPAFQKELEFLLELKREDSLIRPLLFHIAGGAQRLVCNVNLLEEFCRWIETYLAKGNKIDAICLSTHTRCGSYAEQAPADLVQLASPCQSSKQRADLWEAASLLSERFPDILITSHIMHLSPDHGFDNLEQRPMVLG